MITAAPNEKHRTLPATPLNAPVRMRGDPVTPIAENSGDDDFFGYRALK